MTVLARTRRVFRTGNTFRIRRRGIFALIARGTSRIVGTREFGTVAFAVGQRTVGTFHFARPVVARFARFALTLQRIPAVALRTALFFRTAASPVSVSDGIARTTAFFARVAFFTRTRLGIIQLPRRTRRRSGTNAAAFAVGDFRPRTAAFFTGSAFFTFAVTTAFIAVRTRRGGAFADCVMPADRAFGFRSRASRRRANRDAFPLIAFLSVRTVRTLTTRRKIDLFRPRGFRTVFAGRRVPQLDTARNYKRMRIIQRRS